MHLSAFDNRKNWKWLSFGILFHLIECTWIDKCSVSQSVAAAFDFLLIECQFANLMKLIELFLVWQNHLPGTRVSRYKSQYGDQNARVLLVDPDLLGAKRSNAQGSTLCTDCTQTFWRRK